MNCNYKVNIKDIQNKYKFNIFAMGGYNDSDLRKMIESVYYALPRVNGSGTSITLNDTAFSYMKNKLNATDTSQNTTTGKNLLPNNATSQTINGITFTKNDNGTITANGTATADSVLYLNSSSVTIPAGTYTLNGCPSGGSWGTYSMAFGNKNDSGSGTTFTLTESYSSQAYIRIASGYQANHLLFKPMLSTSGGDYEPYTNGASPNPDYPQVIHTITGDNTVKVEGKNLNNGIDYKFYISGTGTQYRVTGTDAGLCISLSSGTYTISTTVTQTRYRVACTNLLPTSNTQDCYNGVVKDGTNNSITINTTGYSYLLVNATDLTKIQIEKGNSATTYQPYQTNAVLLTLGDTEICKIGNYEDKIFKAIKGNEVYDSLASEEKATLDYGKWYLRKAIGKVVLNGSESWVQNSTYQNVYYLDAFLTDATTYQTRPMLSDYFTYGGLITSGSGEVQINKFYQWTGLPQRLMLGYNTTDLATFKTWLSTHNTTVSYPLATPTNELFNDTIQDQLEDIYNNMLSYEGQTNVSQVNDDLPFNINSTAIKDLNNL